MQPVLGRTASKLLRAYYRGPNHPAKLRGWAWLRQLQGYPRFLIPYVNGGWITVDERDYLQNQIFVTGWYEPEVWNTLAAFAISNEVVWDVGGNIGSVAIRALLDPRVREVHTFEPDPLHADILTFNLSVNQGRYRIHPAALSDTNGQKQLHHATFPHVGGSAFEVVPGVGVYEGSFQVQCQTADTLVFSEGIPPPTLMKVDTEGWESHIFLGAERLLKEVPPKAIVFESLSDGQDGVQDKRLAEYLESYGYQISRIKRPEGATYSRENYLALLKKEEKKP